MDGQWTKGTVINTEIAAGCRSPQRIVANGIQGEHFLSPTAASPSRAQNHAMHHKSAHGIENTRQGSSNNLLTKEWATSNNVSYGHF